MIDTKAEILAKYKDRPNAKRIQEIADYNNCTANEIRKILHEMGEEVAVFGRPKKEPENVPQEGNLKEAEPTLNDKTEKEVIKSTSVEPKMPLDIPTSVLDLVHKRILDINRQIEVYIQQVDELNLERNELNDFVKKGEKYEKDGVHRAV